MEVRFSSSTSVPVKDAGPPDVTRRLDCGVCFGRFSASRRSREPIVSSCGHSFCRHCAVQLKNKCANCREVFVGEKNVALVAAIEERKKLEKKVRELQEKLREAGISVEEEHQESESEDECDCGGNCEDKQWKNYPFLGGENANRFPEYAGIPHPVVTSQDRPVRRYINALMQNVQRRRQTQETPSNAPFFHDFMREYDAREVNEEPTGNPAEMNLQQIRRRQEEARRAASAERQFENELPEPEWAELELAELLGRREDRPEDQIPDEDLLFYPRNIEPAENEEHHLPRADPVDVEWLFYSNGEPRRAVREPARPEGNDEHTFYRNGHPRDPVEVELELAREAELQARELAGEDADSDEDEAEMEAALRMEFLREAARHVGSHGVQARTPEANAAQRRRVLEHLSDSGGIDTQNARHVAQLRQVTLRLLDDTIDRRHGVRRDRARQRQSAPSLDFLREAEMRSQVEAALLAERLREDVQRLQSRVLQHNNEARNQEAESGQGGEAETDHGQRRVERDNDDLVLLRIGNNFGGRAPGDDVDTVALPAYLFEEDADDPLAD